jgi:hypothetical protein
MSVFDPRLFYAALATRLASETGKNIGQSVAPATNTTPYAILHPLSEDIDPERLGTLADPHTSTFFEWQVSSYGTTLEQASWMVKEVRDALFNWRPVVAGFSFGLVELTAVNPVVPDNSVQPPLFQGVDLFVVFTTT